jgi:hypothetical protein
MTFLIMVKLDFFGFSELSLDVFSIERNPTIKTMPAVSLLQFK